MGTRSILAVHYRLHESQGHSSSTIGLPSPKQTARPPSKSPKIKRPAGDVVAVANAAVGTDACAGVGSTAFSAGDGDSDCPGIPVGVGAGTVSAGEASDSPATRAGVGAGALSPGEATGDD